MGVKYSVNEEFFNAWSPEMAYVLGFMYADGSLIDAPYMRGKYVTVTSIDKHIIIALKDQLSSQHFIVKAKSFWPAGRTRYILRIGSHKLFNALIKHGLYPNKSLTVGFPDVPEVYLRNFVRGYFDGDGCVFLERSKGKRQRLIVRRLTVVFTSGSKAFLRRLALLLERALGLKQDKIYVSQRAFQLRYMTSDSIKLFKFLYADISGNLYLSRKLQIFTKYFDLRPVKIDKDISCILKRINHGRVVK